MSERFHVRIKPNWKNEYVWIVSQGLRWRNGVTNTFNEAAEEVRLVLQNLDEGRIPKRARKKRL